MDASLRYEDFAGQLDAQFVISEEGNPAVVMTLSECQLLQSRAASPGARPPFSLIFVADTPQMLEQRTYWTEQDVLGRVPLFLVPVGRDERGFQYQAVFN